MRELNPATSRTIGHAEDVDLLAIFRRGATTEHPFLQLQPLITPSPLENFVTRVGACRFRLVVQARGTQADSRTLTLDIALDGTWPPAERAKRCLVIKEVTPGAPSYIGAP